MINDEGCLLYRVLCYEEGHNRRTQHILKVYALAKLFGERERISAEEQQILQAAAIVHDIAIKYCKEHYHGDASQQNQKKEAPHLAAHFLQEAHYLPSYIPRIIKLVNGHHDYGRPRSKLLQLLMEADIIVNCYEKWPDREKMEEITQIFQTPAGKELLALYLRDGMK